MWLLKPRLSISRTGVPKEGTRIFIPTVVAGRVVLSRGSAFGNWPPRYYTRRGDEEDPALSSPGVIRILQVFEQRCLREVFFFFRSTSRIHRGQCRGAHRLQSTVLRYRASIEVNCLSLSLPHYSTVQQGGFIDSSCGAGTNDRYLKYQRNNDTG